MAAKILSGKSLLLPMGGCHRSSSLGHAYPLMRSRNMLFCCRAKSGGRDMYKLVAKTLHRRPRNMKGLKLTNQEVLKELEDEERENEELEDDERENEELEDEERENESIQASDLNMGDNSLAEELEVVSKILNPSDDDAVAIESKVLKKKLE